MNCKDIKDLILTDYLDGEMNEEEKMRIEEHLARCPDCKEFSINARETVMRLFKEPERISPPEYLWRRIKETILTEERKKVPFVAKIFERLKGLLYIPKPALAIVTVLVLIIAVGTMATIRVNNQERLQAGIQEQIEYFDYLSESSGGTSADYSADLGTPVEQYFL
jgi:predicted anti-sigma-YlaC factor YlaD